MYPLETLLAARFENADQIDYRITVFEIARQGIASVDIYRMQGDAGQNAQVPGVFAVAGEYLQPVAATGESGQQMAADEAGAAQDHDALWAAHGCNSVAGRMELLLAAGGRGQAS
ncbi:beta lactamase [Lasius niger]|uniref:Beta lactamase n=1 Tax=Lasius niger TaxID=67767 RepID=A0A0J7JZ06_LASNI|nr:beta lactamase [Lasius niger]